MISTAEHHVMVVVWANEGNSAQQIYQVLENDMNWSLSTVKTLLARLVKKNWLKTEKNGKEFRYFSLVAQHESTTASLTSCLTNVCATHRGDVLSSLLSEVTLGQDDCEKLINVLRQKQLSAAKTLMCECREGFCQCQK